jgi:hypothetical protein
MVSVKTKYLILFWIIILILFTFYCIFRLNYLHEKYGNTPIDPPIPKNTADIISYINNIEKNNKITDVKYPPECQNIYDDDIAVQSLGYNNCENAYSDYLAKGFDINNKYGKSKSLADICPISTKSTLYSQCLTNLLKKFTDNANMVENITVDMTTSINKRLQDRSSILDNIQNQMTTLISNKDQNDFNKYLTVNNSAVKYKEDVLGLVNNYYTNKYEGFVSSVSVNVIEPAIEKLFFGTYKPINGQFLVFTDLTLSLEYDLASQSSQSFQSPQTTKSISSQLTSSESIQVVQPKNIIMTISSKSNGLDIVYNISKINNYKAMPNAIKLSVTSKTVANNLINSSNSQTIQQLLSSLGILAPTQLILTYEEFTSTEKILHKTYKLVNDNLDTILVMNRI